MPDTTDYLIVGAVAAFVTLVTTPIVGAFARRVGWVVQPDERRVHTSPTPDVGGIAMFLGFVSALGVAWQMDTFDAVFQRNSEPLGVLLAAVIVFGVGLIDDIKELSAPAKATGIVLGALVLVWFGVTMYNFRVPFLGAFVLSNDWTPLITALWLLGMTQAINLIDGLDGLAAGIVLISATAFFIYSRKLGDIDGSLELQNIGPLIAIIAVGVCFGFLPHNFNPARIFMGDGGALLLGLLMAVSTSVVGGRADPTIKEYVPGQTYFFLAPIFIPLVILGVPILDTLFAIVRRASRRQSFAEADKRHLHHRLMNLGHGQRRSVMILWLWTAVLSAFVLYPVFTNASTPLIPLGVIALGLALFTVLHPQARRAREAAQNGRSSEAPAPTEPAEPQPDESCAAEVVTPEPDLVQGQLFEEPRE
jgi:UDP-GlcNAc:undecaprenyl-phosphate/decaprenyl-phosphate GlcNAc-1-phosphate transferase